LIFLAETRDSGGETRYADMQNAENTLGQSLRPTASYGFSWSRAFDSHVISFIGALKRFAECGWKSDQGAKSILFSID
jgi:hypothetical protein